MSCSMSWLQENYFYVSKSTWDDFVSILPLNSKNPYHQIILIGKLKAVKNEEIDV